MFYNTLTPELTEVIEFLIDHTENFVLSKKRKKCKDSEFVLHQPSCCRCNDYNSNYEQQTRHAYTLKGNSYANVNCCVLMLTLCVDPSVTEQNAGWKLGTL